MHWPSIKLSFLLLASLLLSGVAIASKASESVSFSRPTQVDVLSDDRDVLHEPDSGLAIDPNDARRMIAVHTRYRAGNSLLFAYVGYVDVLLSEDGGSSWRKVATLRPRSAGALTDPACVIGLDGSITIVAMVSGKKVGAMTWHSSNGMEWTQGADLNLDRTFDRPFFALDRTRGAYRGRIYLFGLSIINPFAPENRAIIDKPGVELNDAMLVMSSDDHGRRFDKSTRLSLGTSYARTSVENGHSVSHTGHGAVLPDGTLLLNWTELDQRKREGGAASGTTRFRTARSVNGGQTFDVPVTVGTSPTESIDDNFRGSRTSSTTASGVYTPTIAADTSGGRFNGRVYSAWTDFSNGQQRTLFSFSDDQGSNWSPLEIISDPVIRRTDKPSFGPNSTTPQLEVNRDGVVGLLYYGQIEHKADYWPIFTYSLDGGLSWSAPGLANPNSYAEMRGNFVASVSPQAREEGSPKAIPRLSIMAKARRNHICSVGFTSDVSGRFHILTLDNKTGDPRFSHVVATVVGKIVTRRALANIEIEFGTVKIDSATRHLGFNVAVRNTGRSSIRLPLRLSLTTTLNQGLVQPFRLISGDNGRTSTGIWVTLNSPGDEPFLTPGAITAKRNLTFRDVNFAGVRSWSFDLQKVAVLEVIEDVSTPGSLSTHNFSSAQPWKRRR